MTALPALWLSLTPFITPPVTLTPPLFALLVTYETVRLLVYVVGVPVIAWLLWSIARRVRAIRDLDAKLREEEAQNAANPYADMARMYEAQELLDKARRGK